MKRYATALIAALLVGLGIAAAPLASAAVLHGNNPQVASGQTVDDDLFIAGNNVEIDGTVNGDVYAAGQTITIRGTVNGDIFAAGQDILISGPVKGSVRTAGNTIRLANAQVGNSFSAAGASITAEKDSSIGGGAMLAGSTVALHAPVFRGLQAAGSNIVIDSSVGRTTNVKSENLTLTSNAKINGDLNYDTNTDLVKDQGSQVTGATNRVQIARHEEAAASKSRSHAGWVVWSLFSLAIVGLVLLWLAPTALPGVANAIVDRPLAAFGWGLLVLILILPVIFILLLTVIGIPLAVLLLLVFGLTLYLSKVFLAILTGNILFERLGQKNESVYFSFLIGLLVLTLLELIPILGGFISILVAIFGLGGVALYGRTRMMPAHRTKA
jgi:cytoskeletal protein CcmA (bactofilin family)